MKDWQLDMSINVYQDCVMYTNENTTLGMAYFSKTDRLLDYIFVHPSYRRQGIGRLLVGKSEELCGTRLMPAEPISPSGKRFFHALKKRRFGPPYSPQKTLRRRCTSPTSSDKRLD